jgi:phosphatidylserine synthase
MKLDGMLSLDETRTIKYVTFSSIKSRTLKNRKLKMSSTLIAIVGVVYAVVAADLLFKGNTGLGIAFVGYALGNVGLFMEASK